MPFDPAQYLAEKTAPAPAASGGFDPAAYLAQKTTPALASPDALGTFLRSFENAGTLNLAPRINGTLSGLSDQLSGSTNDLGTDIDKDTAQSLALLKAGQAQHPTASLLGNLGGGAALGVATEGLGLVPEVATGGGALADALANGAVVGGGSGAIAGAAGSEAPTSTGVINDAVTGGLGGVALGAGAGVAMQGVRGALSSTFGQKLKGAADILGGMNVIARPVEAFKQGLQGQAITGKVGQQAAAQLGMDVAGESGLGSGKNILQMLQDANSSAGQAKTELLKGADQVPQESFFPWLSSAEGATQQARTNTNNDSIGTIQDLINKTFYHPEINPDTEEQELVMNDSISPINLELFKKQLGDMGSSAENGGLADPVARAMANRLMSPMSDRAPNIYETALGLPTDLTPLKSYMENMYPGLSDINNKISALTKAQNLAPSLTQALSAEKGGLGSIQAQDTVNQMLQALNQNPELATTLSPQIKASLENAGKVIDLTNHANAPGLSHGFLADTARGVAIAGANWIGLGAKAMYDMSPEAIQGVAQRIAGMGGDTATGLSNVLSQASGRDRIGRNAIIFAAQQNPAYRELLKKAGVGMDDGTAP